MKGTNLSLIAIVVSFLSIAICVSTSCFDDVSHISIIISTLTILVTVLIGYQIYNIINLESRFDKIKHEYHAELQRESRRSESFITGMVLSEIATGECLKGNNKIAAKFLLNALLYIYKSNTPTSSKRTAYVDTISQNLLTLISDARNNNQHIIFPVEDSIRANYTLAVEDLVRPKEKGEILSFINKLTRLVPEE